MQTILGAGGAIGIELAKALKGYTDDIRLVSRNPKQVHASDKLFPADLTDAAQVMKAVEGSEVVYLTVGLDYKTKLWQATWPPLMKNVIDACAAHGSKLVFFDNVYMIGGDNVRHITESSPISPVSKKGQVRAQLDQMILDAVEKGRLHAIIARAADFYGLVVDKSVIMETVYKNLAKDKTAQWFCNAQVKHSFTYTPDAGKGTAMLGNTPDAFDQVWNLPTHPDALTGAQWVKLFAECMGKTNTKVQVLPKWAMGLLGLFIPIMKEFHEMAYQYDRDYVFDSTKFNTRFNFKPTAPRDGVMATLAAIEGK
jgi:nucleoside-diphosphate-sugar epimerase